MDSEKTTENKIIWKQNQKTEYPMDFQFVYPLVNMADFTFVEEI